MEKDQKTRMFLYVGPQKKYLEVFPKDNLTPFLRTRDKSLLLDKGPIEDRQDARLSTRTGNGKTTWTTSEYGERPAELEDLHVVTPSHTDNRLEMYKPVARAVERAVGQAGLTLTFS